MKLAFPETISVKEIANIIGAELKNAEPNLKVNALQTLTEAEQGSISFLSNPIYIKHLSTTKATVVIVSPEHESMCNTGILLTKNPRLALGKVLNICSEQKSVSTVIHPSAVVASSAKLGKNVRIGAGCVIASDCELDDNVTLHANVTLYQNVKIGKNTTVHSGTVIGSDGFGFALDENGKWFKMQHLGSVVIGENVEIGSNTCIDRGMIDNTIISDNVIIDNLVQIAHNVVIGEGTAIAGCTGIAGSTSIGKQCLLGGACNIAGHITIADQVHITGTSSVNSSIKTAGVYSSGLPARENKEWRRNVARFMHLDSMAKKLKELERQLV